MKKTFIMGIISAFLPVTGMAASLSDQVADDGVVAMPTNTEGSAVYAERGFVGTGKGAAAEGANTSPLSEAEIARIRALPVVSADGAVAESIKGIDTRSKVDPFDSKSESSYPARATALVAFSAGRCTGWLISKDTLVTAGHCVHSGGSSGHWYSRSSYKVYPGYTGSKAPYGFCKAKRLYSVKGWTVNKNWGYDYGVVKLDCTVGKSTGWYGIMSRKSFRNYPTIINGYPGDKPSQQWASSDKVRSESTRKLYYWNDTYGGMSGSPVWFDNNTKGAYAIGIHAYALDSRGYNSATRITPNVLDNLRKWKNTN